MTGDRGMTRRQAAFVREYVIDRNGTQAAIRAGYSPRAASEQAARLLGNAKVASAIGAAEQRLSALADVTTQDIILSLQELAEEATAAGQYASAIRAVELVGRHIGMWPARGVDGGTNRYVDARSMHLHSMSDEELYAIARGETVGGA
jgi:hypothetical protein